LLNTDLKCEDYISGDKKIPALSASASIDNDNRIHISIANLNPGKKIKVVCPISGHSRHTQCIKIIAVIVVI
jgi:alpha-N-arabinofuranosidase